MKLSRKQFLKLIITGAGAVTLAGVIAERTHIVAEHELAANPSAAASPAPTATRAAAGAAPVRAQTPSLPATAAVTPPAISTGADPQKRIWAWLRMFAVGGVPASEAAYKANAARIGVAMPLSGGVLQADGTWQQEAHKIDDDWPQSLPRLGKVAGHLYMPGMGNDREGTLAVLADPQLQVTAAARLVELAQSGRFDSPWDGVYLDIEGIAFSHRSAMSGFLYRLARAVKDAGLLFGVSVGGVTQADTGNPDRDDALDLTVTSEVADFVDLRCYDYASDPPRSIAPYWWIEACVEYALKKGVRPKQMTLGLANFSQYWPDSDAGQRQQITYDRAMQIVEDAGASVEWIERNKNGLVRESYAQAGSGHLWIHDERSYRYGLDLVDQYGLLSSTMFAPGMGNEALWQMIETWEKTRA